MYKYSPSTRGFYRQEIHGDNIPADAIDVADGTHAALMEGQAQGQQIMPGPDSNPYLADPPQSSPPVQPLTVREKLNALGVSLDELKQALAE